MYIYPVLDNYAQNTNNNGPTDIANYIATTVAIYLSWDIKFLLWLMYNIDNNTLWYSVYLQFFSN